MIEISWLLIHLKRDKPGCREVHVVSANELKDYPQRPEYMNTGQTRAGFLGE